MKKARQGLFVLFAVRENEAVVFIGVRCPVVAGLICSAIWKAKRPSAMLILHCRGSLIR